MKANLFNLFKIFIFISIIISLTWADNIRIPKLEWDTLNIESNVGDELPVARKDFAIGYYHDQTEMIIYGGRTKSGDILDDTWLYSFISNRWRKPNLVASEQAVHPPARYGMVYGNDQPPSNSFRSTFVITTGKGEDGIIYNDVWSFDFIRECWTNLTPTGTNIPEPRYDAIGGIDYTRLSYLNQISIQYLILSHGRNDNEYFTDTYVLKLDGRSQQGDYSQLQAEWIKLDTSNVPQAREGITGTVLSGDRLVMYGGCEVKSGNCTTTGYYLDVEFENYRASVTTQVEWQELENECVRPKKYAVAVRGSDQSISDYSTNDRVFLFGGEIDNQYNNEARGEISVFDMDKKTFFGVMPDAKNQRPTPKKGSKMLGAMPIANSDYFNIVLYGGEPLDPKEDWSTDIWVLRVYNEFTYFPTPPTTMTVTECYKILPPEEVKKNQELKESTNKENFSKFLLFALSFMLMVPITVITSRSMNCFTKRWRYIFLGLGSVSVILIFVTVMLRLSNKDTIFILECIVLVMFLIYMLTSILRPKQPNINFDEEQVNAAGVPVTNDEVLSVVRNDGFISPTSASYSIKNRANANLKPSSSSTLLIEPNDEEVNSQLPSQSNKKSVNEKPSFDTTSTLSNHTNDKRSSVTKNAKKSNNNKKVDSKSVSSDKQSSFLSPIFINPNIKEYEEDENEDSYGSDIEEDEEETIKNKYLLMANIWIVTLRVIGFLIFALTIVTVIFSMKDESSRLYKKSLVVIIWIAIIIITYIISIVVAWKMHSSMALMKTKRMSFRSSEPLEPNHMPTWALPVDRMKRFSLVSDGSYGKTSTYEDMCTLSNYSQSINYNNLSSTVNQNYSIPALPVTPNYINHHGIFSAQTGYSNNYQQTPSPPASIVVTNQQQQQQQQQQSPPSSQAQSSLQNQTALQQQQQQLQQLQQLQQQYPPQSVYTTDTASLSAIVSKQQSLTSPYKERDMNIINRNVTLNEMNNNKVFSNSSSSVHSFNSKEELGKIGMNEGRNLLSSNSPIPRIITTQENNSMNNNNNIMMINSNISSPRSNSMNHLIQQQQQQQQQQRTPPPPSTLSTTSKLTKMNSYGSLVHLTEQNPSSSSPNLNVTTTLPSVTTPTSSVYESENEIELPQRNNTIDNLSDKEVMVVMTVPKRKLAVVNL